MHERLWARVVQYPVHWLWQGAVDRDGYGKLRIGGRKAGWVKAHRLVYMIFYGPILPGCDVHHTCRIRRCVRPEHLVAVPFKLNRGRWSPALVREVNRMDFEFKQLVETR